MRHTASCSSEPIGFCECGQSGRLTVIANLPGVTTPRRTLVVTQDLGAGGAERQVVHLAVGLAAEGHLVTLLCIGLASLAEREMIERAGVRLVSLGAPSLRQRAMRLPRMIALARREDVVVCSNFDATFWGRVAAIVARRPVIVIEHAVYRTLQTSRAGRPRGRWIALHNRLLDRFTYATVACASAQLPVLRSEGVAESRLVLIPNGVPVGELREQAREQDVAAGRAKLGIAATSLVVIHVARLTALKNQRQTLDTVRELRMGGLDVHALIVGEGEDWDELRAASAGEPWVRMLGGQDRVAPLFALADMAVLPSSAEAMPMVVAESLAIGVPMVATDVGDVGQILRRTGAGIAVPAGDPMAFTAACRVLLADDEERARVTACAQAAGDTFDASIMSRRYGKLITSAALRLPPSGDSGTAPDRS
jgi:glycosyltransferase involved in cell wall biosynthesis